MNAGRFQCPRSRAPPCRHKDDVEETKRQFSHMPVRAPRLDTNARPLSHTQPYAQHYSAHNHSRAARSALVSDVGIPWSWLLDLPVARGTGCWLSRTAFYDP